MKLLPVNPSNIGDVTDLYAMLEERTPEQSINHKQMPSFDQHDAFVSSNPYEAWYLALVDGIVVGNVYVTKHREVGIHIFRRYRKMGYGAEALTLLRRAHPGRLLANISIANLPSIAFFTRHGARLIQLTYEIPPKEE